MDGVGSLVSQAQPLLESSRGSPSGTAPANPWPVPVTGTQASQTLHLPSQTSSNLPPALLSIPPQHLAQPAPVAPHTAHASQAAASPAPSTPADLASLIARAAQQKANRRHRRRYTLPDPFGLHPRQPPKRRRANPALPARMASLIQNPKEVARVAQRLTQHEAGWHWFRSAFDKPITKGFRRDYQKASDAGLAPMVALVLAGMLAHTTAWSSRGRRARLIEGLTLLNPHERSQLAWHLFTHPNDARALRQAFVVQERLELYQAGDSFATFLRFSRNFMQTATPLPNSAWAKDDVDACAIQLAQAPVSLGQAWQAHGRTLHFKNAQGTVMGLKLRKNDADATALEREDVMDQCFAKWQPALGLLGSFPRSLGLLLFAPDAQVRAAVAAQASAHGAPQFDIGAANLMPGLLYETPQDYHVHLHEVASLQALQEASHKTLHDAGLLAGRAGMVHMSPADFYHNREKDRRWYWNVDHVQKAMFGRVGTGRLDRVDAGVRYYNAGPSGLRDLKHFAFYDDVKSEYGDDATLALTSTMGDFLLAWTLSVCKWFNDHQQLEAGLDLQEVLQQGFVTYFAAFTARAPADVRSFLGNMVNWPLLARQIQYFCSNAYVADIKRGSLPTHVMERGTQSQARVPEEGWNPEEGWMLDGETRDLGPKNGPFPITELVAALYVTTSFALAVRKP